MNKILKTKIDDNKNELQVIDNKIEILKEKILLQEQNEESKFKVNNLLIQEKKLEISRNRINENERPAPVIDAIVLKYFGTRGTTV
jgi:hypothetical protein